jgi:hypothetical protein
MARSEGNPPLLYMSLASRFIVYSRDVPLRSPSHEWPTMSLNFMPMGDASVAQAHPGPFLNASAPNVRNCTCETSLKPDAKPQEAEAHSAISPWKHIVRTRFLLEPSSQDVTIIFVTAAVLYEVTFPHTVIP